MTEIRFITQNLVSNLEQQLEQATTVYWITAFAMKSGVDLVLPSLVDAAKRGADIKLLVGDYLSITQPEALRRLIDAVPEAEVRIYQSHGLSFHPKAYLFRNTTENTLIVGSSNLSKSALTNGIEWSLSVPTPLEEPLFEEAATEFMRLFYHPQTLPMNSETFLLYEAKYNENNKAMPLSSLWANQDEIEVMFGTDGTDHEPVLIETNEIYSTDVTPRPAQELALKALEESMEEEYDKALAVMATGLGKTYLAAFFAERFKRVLFVAHREEILYQARDSFQHVHNSKKTGLYNATNKDIEADFLFASVATLSQEHHLAKFQSEEFDLIVVDEFHHATAPSYMRIINHFKPRFLLGITATPHRLDNSDVFGICDGNVAITINFLDAIQKQWLAPFKYFGVYDDTDYSQLRWVGTGYAEEDLARVQLHESMAEMIFSEWQSKKQTRTIGFCSSVRQAQFLANYFKQQGIHAISLDAKSDPDVRKSARQKLNDGELEIIFTVDLFNEGVDIPKVDTLLFVRPTESLAVFTQQIGRGLRLADGKDHCVIIDLIGNYRNADLKWRVFSPEDSTAKGVANIADALPMDCEIHLDTQVVDLVQHMIRKYRKPKDVLLSHYYELKADLGRRPTYLEFHLQTPVDTLSIRREFGSYFNLIQEAGDLSTHEERILRDYQAWLVEVEKTSMTKSYKMTLLHCMLQRGPSEWYKPILAEEVAQCFYEFLWGKKFRRDIDFTPAQQIKFSRFDQQKVAKHVEDNPMKFWSGKVDGLVRFENKEFWFDFDVAAEDQEILFQWTKEICEFRLHWYFERKAKRLN
ncbi:DEAD/DEAH box helicase family protein [Chryseomicrobium aureum]|uniref:DEAD/DEAH box helicase family protein n=1 Tax=Chryseomicrobium aureum TaxID=1441723 RepID=UPI00370D1673